MAAPVLFAALGALLLLGSSPSKKKISAMTGTPPQFSSSGNQYGLVGCDPYHTPSGKTDPRVVAGYATHPDYQWCYVVRDGDSAGSITEMFFGADQGWRYTELLAANPKKQIKGKVVTPDGSEDELNFVSLVVGETLFLPRTWNGYIDQTGVPRAKSTPMGMVA